MPGGLVTFDCQPESKHLTSGQVIRERALSILAIEGVHDEIRSSCHPVRDRVTASH